MTASWEIKKANSVLVVILHVEMTTIAWAIGLRNLIIPGNILPLTGMPFDHGRNAGVQRMLESGAQYCFFLDSDVVPPRDTILRLMAHNLPIVSGVYARRSPPHAVPVAIKNGTWLTQYQPGAMVEVDLVGAGCLLVKREVFEKMPPSDARRGKRWFDWRVDMMGIGPPNQPCLSEDFQFNYNAKCCGYKTWLDTSIVCRHVGAFQVTPGDSRPLECSMT